MIISLEISIVYLEKNAGGEMFNLSLFLGLESIQMRKISRMFLYSTEDLTKNLFKMTKSETVKIYYNSVTLDDTQNQIHFAWLWSCEQNCASFLVIL